MSGTSGSSAGSTSPSMENESPLGVLLMAYGTPGSLDEVEPYYTDIRRGRPPPPELLSELIERYRLVGGRTPLLEISRRQADALQRRLGPDFRVFLGMKHWHPYIRDAVADMRAARVSRAVAIVLAPHYSLGSVGEYADRVERAKEELSYRLDVEVVRSWHLSPHYLDAVQRHIVDALARLERPDLTTIVFTAHSLPVRVAATGDPYEPQLLETSQALAARLGWPEERWRFSYQSAGRTADPWLGPDILETVEELARQGVSEILLAPIGFIADHLEIFYDIDHEATAAAAARGMRLSRIESLNDDPDLIEALAKLAEAQLLGSGVTTGA